MSGEGGGMRFHLSAFIIVALLSSPANAAVRSFTVTGFDRIRVDGPYRVRLTTNVAPFARASGSPAGLDSVSVEVQGRTLVVRRNSSAWGGNSGHSRAPVEIEVGTHELSSAWVNGSGGLRIDQVRGAAFDLTVSGSGAAEVGGVAVDRLKIGLTGTASARLAGNAVEASTLVRGTSTFDGTGLIAKNATVGAEGASVVRLNVTGTAKVDANGPATIEFGGRPACTTRSNGAADVIGCR